MGLGLPSPVPAGLVALPPWVAFGALATLVGFTWWQSGTGVCCRIV